MRRWLAIAAALLAAAALLVLGVRPAAAAPTPLSEFAKPHRLVDIGQGRKLNLFCTGEGRVTVLLDAGGSDWSAIWGLVQPALEGDARVCSYDRAGMGYSDPAPGPRTPFAIVDDLDQLIAAAKLDGPLVLVGHSLGGFHAKLFTALHRDKVKGLVLVDPSEERGIERSRGFMLKQVGPVATAAAELGERDFFRGFIARYDRCVAQAEAGALTDPALYRRCSDPVRPKLGPEIAAERARLQPLATYQRAQASEIRSSIYGLRDDDPTYAVLFRPGRFGALPMIVLTHGNHDPKDPQSLLDFQSWNRLHKETARLSTIGVQRVVPDSDHNIEIDQPGAIVRAVRELIAKVR